MEWLAVRYQPTTLFTLKPSWATSTGGKTLLLPSPYALKMALLDVAIRTNGLKAGIDAWHWLRELALGIQLPPQIVVTNLFGRILRQKEIKSKASEKPAKIAEAMAQKQWPYQHSIGFREYAYFAEPWQLSIGYNDVAHTNQLALWLAQINYLGKRGGFVQLLEPPRVPSEPTNYTVLTQDQIGFPLQGLIQALDDCDPKMTFTHANIYDKKRPKRITRHIVLPYTIKRSSKAYTWYEKVS